MVGKKNTKETIGSSFETEGDQEFQQIYLSIDFSNFPAIATRLTVWVTDLEIDKTESAEKRFVLK